MSAPIRTLEDAIAWEHNRIGISRHDDRCDWSGGWDVDDCALFQSTAVFGEKVAWNVDVFKTADGGIYHRGKSGLRRGDLVLYDWNSNGLGDHVEMALESPDGAGNFETIGANRSATYEVKTGTRNGWVLGYFRPNYLPATHTAGESSTPITDEEIQHMATGLVYKSATKNTVWWQERPNSPFVGLDGNTYKALLAAGAQRGPDVPDAEMDALLKKWGTLDRPQGASARGVAYRRTSDGSVFWQDKPGAPLIGLSPVEWAALKQNGLLYVDYSADQLAPLLAAQ